MKLLTATPRQGVLWVRRGFALFFKLPLPFAGLFGACLFIVLVMNLLPWIGPLLLLVALPLGSLGFMIATRTALEGRAPSVGALFEPLRGSRSCRVALLQLGVVYAVASVGIMLVADLADGGALDALIEALGSAKDKPEVALESLANSQLALGMAVRFGLAGLLSVPFWHAPALVFWGNHGAAKALFSSCVACWRNRGAFAAYGAAWVAVILLFGVLVNLVFAVLGQIQWVALATLPATLLFSTVFYVSLYFTFADCFDLAPDAAPAAGSP